jgi:putative ABC transport system substrate-binding protein
MKRRRFISLLGGAAAALPFGARAQQRDRVRRIALLFSLGENDPEQRARRDALREVLQQRGWSDGRDVKIESRYANGDARRFALIAKEIVALEPDVIFVQSTGFTAAVHKETHTIPVVFTNVSDPVGSGFVASLPRPGGNLTGLTLFDAGISGKWLGMLKEIAPRLKRAAVLINPVNTPFEYFVKSIESAASSLAIEVVPMRVENAEAIEAAMRTLVGGPNAGFIVPPGSTMLNNRGRIIALAASLNLPAVYPERIYAVDGGLLTYGIAEHREPFRQAATYIDRILRGERPSELPVQGPTKYATVVNLKTAKAMGITVPAGLLVAADEVIE